MATITVEYKINEKAIERIQWHTDWSRRKALKEIRKFLLCDTYRPGDNMEIIRTEPGHYLSPLDPDCEPCNLGVALITDLFG